VAVRITWLNRTLLAFRELGLASMQSTRLCPHSRSLYASILQDDTLYRAILLVDMSRLGTPRPKDVRYEDSHLLWSCCRNTIVSMPCWLTVILRSSTVDAADAKDRLMAITVELSCDDMGKKPSI